MISVRDVVVSYNGRRVLDGINLDICRGETMVLLGGSGSGKSTLLRQIIGLERPQSGQILVNGVDLAKSTTEGSEKGTAFDWGRVSECRLVQFDVGGRQYRAASPGAHTAGRIDDSPDDLDEARRSRAGETPESSARRHFPEE